MTFDHFRAYDYITLLVQYEMFSKIGNLIGELTFLNCAPFFHCQNAIKAVARKLSFRRFQIYTQSCDQLLLGSAWNIRRPGCFAERQYGGTG